MNWARNFRHFDMGSSQSSRESTLGGQNTNEIRLVLRQEARQDCEYQAGAMPLVDSFGSRSPKLAARCLWLLAERKARMFSLAPMVARASTRQQSSRRVSRTPRRIRSREYHPAHDVYRVIGSLGYPVPEDVLRSRVEASVYRSYYPQGIGRQMLAILSDGSRVKRLSTIKGPTLVIHGADDPLVPLAAGKHTAQAIPGAKLEIYQAWAMIHLPVWCPRSAGSSLTIVGRSTQSRDGFAVTRMLSSGAR